jgi:hypothetical protein
MSKERSASAPAGGALDAEVATALRSRLPDVAARTVEAVTAEVADYADTWSGDYGANIAQAVELALAAFLRLAEEPEPVVSAQRLGPVLEAAYALGRGEARSGRTMDALQSAYRVGARVAWEQWSTAALDAGLPARSLIRFASLVFDYIDQLSAASVTGTGHHRSGPGAVPRAPGLGSAQQCPGRGDGRARAACRLATTPDADVHPGAVCPLVNGAVVRRRHHPVGRRRVGWTRPAPRHDHPPRPRRGSAPVGNPGASGGIRLGGGTGTGLARSIGLLRTRPAHLGPLRSAARAGRHRNVPN